MKAGGAQRPGRLLFSGTISKAGESTLRGRKGRMLFGKLMMQNRIFW